MAQKMDGMLVNQASRKSGVLGDKKIVMIGPGLFQIQQLANMAASRRGQADAQAEPVRWFGVGQEIVFLPISPLQHIHWAYMTPAPAIPLLSSNKCI
jgi:hypothetical protein